MTHQDFLAAFAEVQDIVSIDDLLNTYSGRYSVRYYCEEAEAYMKSMDCSSLLLNIGLHFEGIATKM